MVKEAQRKTTNAQLRLLGEVAQENPSRHNYKSSYENPYYFPSYSDDLPYDAKNRNYVYDSYLMLAAMYNEGLGVVSNNTKRAKEWFDAVPYKYRRSIKGGLTEIIPSYETLLRMPPEFSATEPR